jgi:hypothetical protein
MQLLSDLLHSEKGRDFLLTRGIFTEPGDFAGVLTRPERSELSDFLGLAKETPDLKLVCSGQQIYIDYHFSVLAKIALMRYLINQPGLTAFFIWHDTDRSGSDPLITKFEWPMGSKTYPIKIAPPGKIEVETRFVELDPDLLNKGLETLKNYVFQGNFGDKTATRQRFNDLRDLFLENNRASLSEFNYRVTSFLLKKQFGWNPGARMLSDLLANNILTAEVELILNNLSGFVQVYNAAIEDLKRLDIDPQVHFLTEDYLPLYYSCEVDDRRLRLLHLDGPDGHYAAARCKCGQEYRFFLGSKVLSLAEISRTGRWGPDVSLPVLLNRQVSGLIMGKSSALYGLIMKEVLAKALGQTPLPFLIPKSLAEGGGGGDGYDSLMYHYLAGKEQPLA